MIIELDGALMTYRTTAHDYLKAQVRFPDYYGRNLDALYDLLTETAEPTTIILRNADQMQEQLGAYGAALLVTLHQAEENTPALSLEIY